MMELSIYYYYHDYYYYHNWNKQQCKCARPLNQTCRVHLQLYEVYDWPPLKLWKIFHLACGRNTLKHLPDFWNKLHPTYVQTVVRFIMLLLTNKWALIQVGAMIFSGVRVNLMHTLQFLHGVALGCFLGGGWWFLGRRAQWTHWSFPFAGCGDYPCSRRGARRGGPTARMGWCIKTTATSLLLFLEVLYH